MKVLRKILMIFAFVMTLLMLTKVSVYAASDSFTWDLTTNSYTSASTTLVQWDSDYATFKIEKGSSQTVANNYIPTAKTSTRFYKLQNVTITPINNYTLSSLVFEAASTTYATALNNSTFINASSSISGTTVTLTVVDGNSVVSIAPSAAVGLKSLEITFSSPSVQEKEYTVSFDSTGGTDVAPQTITENELATKPNNPTKENYDFLGWYLNDEEYDFNTPITSDITLIAKWKYSNGYEFIFNATEFEQSGSKYLNEIEWNISGTGSYFGYNTEKGQQFGSEANPFKEGALSTDGFSDKYITSVIINISGASNIAAYVNVKVGDSFLEYEENNSVNLTSTPTTYQFDALSYAEGDLSIEWTQTSSKAVYIKSIIVIYTDIPQNISYNVTFNSNGGSQVGGYTDVAKNTKIIKPTDPVFVGYDFIGWYKDELLTEVWDFDNDLVNSDLVLYARWEIEGLMNSLEKLNNIKSYMSMAFAYKVEGSNTTAEALDTLNNGNTVNNTSTTYTAWTYTGTSGAVYSGQSSGGNSAIQLRATSPSGIVSTVSGGKITKIEVVWNSNTSSGRTLDIYGKNTAYSEPKDLYSSSTQGTKAGSIVKGTSTVFVFDEGYEYVGVRSNKNAMWIDSITFTWSSGSNTTEYSLVDFRMKFGVDYELNQVTEELENATYGISIKTDDTEVKIPINECNVENIEGKKYTYVIIKLGDVLNVRERLITDFTVTSYVEVNGETYYSENAKTYSVKSLTQYYLDYGLTDASALAALNNLKEIMISFGYIEE